MKLKKVLALSLAAAMTFSLIGCGSDDGAANDTPAADNTTTEDSTPAADDTAADDPTDRSRESSA